MGYKGVNITCTCFPDENMGNPSKKRKKKKEKKKNNNKALISKGKANVTNDMILELVYMDTVTVVPFLSSFLFLLVMHVQL